MLADIRKEWGLSQKDVADAIGVHLNTMQNWEANGLGNAKVKHARALAKYLGCTIEDFFDEESD